MNAEAIARIMAARREANTDCHTAIHWNGGDGAGLGVESESMSSCTDDVSLSIDAELAAMVSWNKSARMVGLVGAKFAEPDGRVEREPEMVVVELGFNSRQHIHGRLYTLAGY